jgi:hypothetical protein
MTPIPTLEQFLANESAAAAVGVAIRNYSNRKAGLHPMMKAAIDLLEKPGDSSLAAAFRSEVKATVGEWPPAEPFDDYRRSNGDRAFSKDDTLVLLKATQIADPSVQLPTKRRGWLSSMWK